MNSAVINSMIMMKSAHDVKNSLSPASAGSSESTSSSTARRRISNAVSRSREAMVSERCRVRGCNVQRTHRSEPLLST